MAAAMAMVAGAAALTASPAPVLTSAAATHAAIAPAITIAGNWIVDLRPSDTYPTAYDKPMVLVIAADHAVSGEFYDHPIESGHYAHRGTRECVMFRTSDLSGPYQHQGCVVGDRIEGMSWAEGRKFLLLWTAKRGR
ncbi:MAG: hypothetical protein H7241_03000 [Novosphingobium sp.]|nr:hypothetical protein [Novosphingobium sp.]